MQVYSSEHRLFPSLSNRKLLQSAVFLVFLRLCRCDFIMILKINFMSYVITYMFTYIYIYIYMISFTYFVPEKEANLPFGLSTCSGNAFSCSSRSVFTTKTDRALILLYSSQFCVLVRTVFKFVAARKNKI